MNVGLYPSPIYFHAASEALPHANTIYFEPVFAILLVVLFLLLCYWY